MIEDMGWSGAGWMDPAPMPPLAEPKSEGAPAAETPEPKPVIGLNPGDPSDPTAPDGALPSGEDD